MEVGAAGKVQVGFMAVVTVLVGADGGGCCVGGELMVRYSVRGS